MNTNRSCRDDTPRTLTQRLQQLNDNLEILGDRLKDGIVQAISETVANAIRDSLCALLGQGANALDYRPAQTGHSYQSRWDDSQEEEEEEDRWHEDRCPKLEEDRFDRPRKEPSRWQQALGVAVQSAFFWLRRQHSSRPILLTTTLVAVTGGVVTLLGGPTLGAAVVALTTAVGLLFTADAASPQPTSRSAAAESRTRLPVKQ